MIGDFVYGGDIDGPLEIHLEISVSDSSTSSEILTVVYYKPFDIVDSTAVVEFITIENKQMSISVSDSLSVSEIINEANIERDRAVADSILVGDSVSIFSIRYGRTITPTGSGASKTLDGSISSIDLTGVLTNTDKNIVLNYR